ncbi:hypothetical protein DLn1_00015 [Bacillus phage DLn1]|nr:hypothetical protein DLn1_00015 [Bacillus phage DLn1]
MRGKRYKLERKMLIELGRHLFESAEELQYNNLSNLYNFLYDGASLYEDIKNRR